MRTKTYVRYRRILAITKEILKIILLVLIVLMKLQSL